MTETPKLEITEFSSTEYNSDCLVITKDNIYTSNGKIGIGTLGITKYECPKHGETYNTIMIVKDDKRRVYCQSCVSEMITPELIESTGIMPIKAKE